MENTEETLNNWIINLSQWNGGWASRCLYDNCIEKILLNEEQDIDLAKKVFQNSTGHSAFEYLKKYERITGLNFKPLPELDIDTKTIQQLIALKEIGIVPYELTYDYWLDKLCNHLNCTRKNVTEVLNNFFKNEVYAKEINNVEFLLNNWSFPIIFNILSIEPFDVDFKYVENEMVVDAWKRWFKIKGKSILVETPDKSNLKISQWIIWRLIHDATHLIQLQKIKQEKSYYEPELLLSMEGVAMYVEYEFLQRIEKNKIILPNTIATSIESIKTILLLGFVERALRLDYDLSVHLYENNIFDWENEVKRTTGLRIDIFSFIKEFHGLPGFSSCYMLGLWSFMFDINKKDVINGVKVLDFYSHRKADELSCSSLTDIPSFESKHALYIDRVGTINNLSFVLLFNPFVKKYLMTEVDTKMYISLDENKKGIHMSRLQEILVNIPLEKEFYTLVELAKYILDFIILSQKSKQIEVILQSNSFIDTEGNFTKKKSRQPITLISSIVLNGNEIVYKYGIKLRIMTACPCTLEYSKQKSRNYSYEFDNRNGFNGDFPQLYTHSQAGYLTVIVETKQIQFEIENLYQKICKSVHIVESVLKRPDEHFLVHKNHNKPMFCEDVCRDVAVSVASILNEFDALEIIAELEESIHPHKAYAHLKSLAKDIWY